MLDISCLSLLNVSLIWNLTDFWHRQFQARIATLGESFKILFLVIYQIDLRMVSIKIKIEHVGFLKSMILFVIEGKLLTRIRNAPQHWKSHLKNKTSGVDYQAPLEDLGSDFQKVWNQEGSFADIYQDPMGIPMIYRILSPFFGFTIFQIGFPMGFAWLKSHVHRVFLWFSHCVLQGGAPLWFTNPINNRYITYKL